MRRKEREIRTGEEQRPGKAGHKVFSKWIYSSFLFERHSVPLMLPCQIRSKIAYSNTTMTSKELLDLLSRQGFLQSPLPVL